VVQEAIVAMVMTKIMRRVNRIHRAVGKGQGMGRKQRMGRGKGRQLRMGGGYEWGRGSDTVK
jgi:hypothetical protein